MDLSNLKNKNVHEKRMSDRTIFWGAILIVIFLAHYYLYMAVGRHLNPILEGIWLFTGVLAMLSSLASKRLGAPRKEIRNMPMQSALNRFGAVWNIFVVLTTTFMLLVKALSLLLPRISFEISFAVSCLAALAVCVYGVTEARTIQHTHMLLKTHKLAKGHPRIRIVQLSDLHISPFMNVTHITRVVEATLKAMPDLIVITGDMIDGVVGDEQELLPFYRPYAERMGELHKYGPRLGVWAIPGNHDYYEGFADTLTFLKTAGIHLLQTEKVDLGEIVLLGVDDLDHIRKSDTRPQATRSEELVDSLTAEERRKFVLLLRHRPVVERATIGSFDLQLSGHTHGGQLFFIPSSRHKIPGKPKGLLSLGQGSDIYVSNGAGFVGPPMRFLAPAEIVITDLVPDES